MEFQARLKRKHLMDLISYVKTAQNAAKGEEEENAAGSLNFMEECLFIGLMPFELKQAAALAITAPTANKKGQPAGRKPPHLERRTTGKEVAFPFAKEEQNSYNPCSARHKEGPRITQIWSGALVTQLQVSMQRYLRYVDSDDCIRKEEISQYRKVWMSKTLDMIPDNVLQRFPSETRLNF